MKKTEPERCEAEQALTRHNDALSRGKFVVGDMVRSLMFPSEYYGLVGKLISIEPTGYSGMVKFADSELKLAMNPDRVRRAKPQVHFYFRYLQKVDQLD